MSQPSVPLTDFHSAIDLRVFRFFNRDGGPSLDSLMRLLSARAFGVAFGIALVALIWVALRRGAFRAVLALGIAIVVSDLIGGQWLRPVFGRMRPCYALAPGEVRWIAPAANGPSLPSLHASNMFALALVVTLARPRLAPLAYVVAVLVSISRMYVGVHWPTDVLAGVVWGTLAGTVGWTLARVMMDRERGPQPR